MKKIVTSILIFALLISSCLTLISCGEQTDDYVVGICQLVQHDSLDEATRGFTDALTEELAKHGKTVKIDTQVATGEQSLCTTITNTFVSKKVDLIMANATPALLAAANATANIPVLGTSVTDYDDTFANNIPANVSGTSDAVPFDLQAQMMIDTLNLQKGDTVGVLYCSDESNSKLQYEAVKAYFESKEINVVCMTFSDTSALQSTTEKLCEASKAIYIPSDNTVANNDSVVGTICEANDTPVFTSYGGKICYASLAIDYYELGRLTGVMAAEILLGEKTVAETEIAKLTPTKVYNDELCAKYNVTKES